MAKKKPVLTAEDRWPGFLTSQNVLITNRDGDLFACVDACDIKIKADKKFLTATIEVMVHSIETRDGKMVIKLFTGRPVE